MEQVVRLSDAIREDVSLEVQLAHVLDAARGAVAVDRLHLWAITPGGDALLYVRGSGLSQQDRSALSERPQMRLCDAGALARAVREKTALLVNGSASRIPRQRMPISTVGTAGFYVVPLIARGRTLGLLVADNKYNCLPLVPKALRLLPTFALHLAAAVDNASLLSELRTRDRDLTEALEQQTATAAILRVISRSPNDLAPVFDSILESATRLCDAHLGMLSLYDGEAFNAVAMRGVSPAVAEQFRVIRPGPHTGVGRLLVGKRPVHIPDVTDDDAYRQGDPLRLATVELLGAHTWLGVPLLKDDTVAGAVVIYRREVRPFSEAQIGLVQTFADQAVIAIENTRLFKELETRNRDLTESLEQQTATSEILRVISSSPTDLEPVLDAVVRSAARLCQASDAVIFRVEGESLQAVKQLGSLPPVPGGGRIPIRRDLISGRAILERRTVQIADPLAEPEHEFATGREIALRMGYRTVVVAPMMREGEPVGAIGVWRREVRPFSDTQIALLQTFADQAVIAVENTRLFKELQARNRDLTESLEQQTATGKILRVISRSPTDVQPVFDTIVESAVTLCNAEVGNVTRFDGEWVHMAAMHVDPSGADKLREIYPARPSRGLASLRAIHDSTVVHIPDILEDAGYQNQEAATAAGFRAVLSVPMLRDGRAIGSLTIGRSAPGAFSDKQIALLTTFADQAVIAIENVRLFKELEARNRDLTESLEQQTSTSEILRVISQSQADVQPVFETIAANARRLCAGTFGGVWTFDGNLIHLMATDGFTPDAIEALRRSFPRTPGRGGSNDRAISTRRVVYIPDVRQDPEYELLDLAQAIGFVSMLSVPMLRHGMPIGTIGVSGAKAGMFSERQIAMLQTFADQAVIAIENTRLFNELQTRNRDLTEALEQQTATSDILRVISQSQRDVQPVFETIAASAQKLCEANLGAVFTFDGDLINVAALHSITPEGLEAVQRAFPMPPSRGGIAARAVLTRAVLYIPDVHEDAEFRLQGLAQAVGVRSALSVPMLRDGSPIGAISVTGAEPAMFSERQIAMLQTFADQAVIAIENTRLFTELQARTAELGRSVEELKALGEVGSAVSSTLDLDTVLTTILTHANQLAGTQAGQIFDYDEATEALSPRATFGYTQDIAEALRRNPIKKGEGVTGQAILRRQPVQIPDIAAEGAYDSRLRNLIMGSGFRALLAVPLIREDQVMGALAIARTQPGEFPPQVIDLLTTFASQSALAMQNARLFHQLEIASHHKSTFLANMSHELRTPLNAIIGYSEMLQEDAADQGAERLVPDLKRVNAAGKHLLELINSILDLSKIEAGKMELQLEDFSVAGMVDDIRAVIQPLAESNGNRLELVCDAAAGTMHADLTKVRQVLFNLLSNACKFTERGTVSLAVHREESSGDAWLSFSVSDTGIGLSADQLGRLFQEFSQAHADAKRKYGGTGLGLALSRRLCRLMGGDISVTSEPGKGSTFTVRLPVDVGQIHEVTGHAAGDAGTVLVIDDEAVVRELMQRFLGKEGFRVLTAASGQDGLRLAREQRPDVVTLDVMMPGMDGWAVLCALTTDPQLADIPVIMLTIVDDKKMGYALGASEYLTKPIDRARLVAVLTKYRRELPVLVVDDDASVRQLLRRILEEEGYTVVEADNGRIALERVGEHVPGAILLDLMMPEMDGFEFLGALHGREAWRHIPVVIVTAKDLTSEEHDRLNGSVVRILQKGAYAQEELLAEVRTLVGASIGRRKGRSE